MARKRTPKHLERYIAPERAARMLEQQARLIGKGPHNHLIAIELTFRRWYADEGAPVGAAPTTGTPKEGNG